MPSESRHIQRPRPSLSCLTCRRRKVRCGREKSMCHNCVRMNETCLYENDIPQLNGPQAKKRPAKNASKGGLAQRKASRAYLEEDSAESSDFLAQLPGNMSSPPSAFLGMAVGDAQGNEPARSYLPLVDDANLVQDDSWEFNDTASTILPWETPGQREYGNMLSSALSGPNNPNGSPLIGPSQSSPLSQTRHQATIDSGPLRKHVEMNTPARAVTSCSFAEPCTISEAAIDQIHSSSYLAVRNGGRTRYAGPTFWALIKGRESLGNDYLQETYNSHGDMLNPYIDGLELAKLLKLLPTQPVCDVLLRSFLVGIRPIHPLIHVPTFRKDYDSFWHWCRNNTTLLPDEKLFEDPTFFALLFAVLYCGAIAAPPSLWSATELQELNQDSLIEQLRGSHHTALRVCQHLRRPTFNTLVASLLGHSCAELDDEQVERLAFVSTVVRMAQSMGLHRDGTEYRLDAVTSEMRRRVWWHIVWLDVQASAMNGLRTCCGSTDSSVDSEMVSGLGDEDISELCAEDPSLWPARPTGATSASMLFAIGRYEAARVKQTIVNHLNGPGRPSQAQITSMISAVERLHLKIDALMARLPVKGIPERGFVPSRLKHASPLTHERLYGDHLSEPTVLTSWIRIMLTMQKSEVAILLQKSFFGRADTTDEQERRMWNSAAQQCSLYLGSFLQLAHLPAFTPYSWFCPIRYPPLEPLFVILTYLEHRTTYPDAQLARHLVDEVIEIFVSDDNHTPALWGQGLKTHDFSFRGSKCAASSWEVIRAMRAKLDISHDTDQTCDQSKEPTHFSSHQPFSFDPLMSIGPPKNKTASAMVSPTIIAGRTGTASGTASPPSALFPCNGSDEMLDLSALDAWSSSLGLFSDGGLRPGSDNMMRAMSVVTVAPSEAAAKSKGSTTSMLYNDSSHHYGDGIGRLGGSSGGIGGAQGKRGEGRDSNGHDGDGVGGVDDDSGISVGGRGTTSSDEGIGIDKSWIDAWVAWRRKHMDLRDSPAFLFGA